VATATSLCPCKETKKEIKPWVPFGTLFVLNSWFGLFYLRAKDGQRDDFSERFVVHFLMSESAVNWKISKVLWELVLTALKREFITRSYASDLLGISPTEIQDILYELEEIEHSQS
jgi:hypothetical protein